MKSGAAFLPGKPLRRSLPLGRFLPPVQEGIAVEWLQRKFANLSPGARPWILDPFGACPSLAVEIAHHGFRLLVAANNPIARLLLEIQANPPTENECRAAIAELAASYKGAERIEPHIRSLYRSTCGKCGEELEADAFIWDRGARTPSAKIIRCPACGANGEFPTNELDQSQALKFSASGLHRSRALERVAALDDPDRQHAEEALDSYLPRAIYALFTLINKLESLPATRKVLEPLLLAVFDQANSLWPYQTQRSRPKQLTYSPRFKENNVWSALEAAAASIFKDTNQAPLPVTYWPELPPPDGGICIYVGKIKDLAQSDLFIHSIPLENQIGAVLTAIPRPNQAFWTLSALWAGWLWGREAAGPFKSVIRRRRYDWTWHSAALSAAFDNFRGILEPATPIFGLINEVEPGFLSAALVAGYQSGLRIQSIAMQAEDDQAQIEWITDSSSPKTPPQMDPSATPMADCMSQAALEYLGLRQEPSPYIFLQSAALNRILEEERGCLDTDLSPVDLFTKINSTFSQAFSYRSGFSRFGGSEHSLDVGLWWFRDEEKRNLFSTVEFLSRPPFSDQVEMAVVRFLQANPGISFQALERLIYQEFRGLLTPDRLLLQTCLLSYAVPTSTQEDAWTLRPEDQPENRRLDLREARQQLLDIGQKLGYQCQELAHEEATGRAPVVWMDENGLPQRYFYIQGSALASRVLLHQPHPPQQCILVIPGGRSGLLEYKMRKAPHVLLKSTSGWRFLKLRNLRRINELEAISRPMVEAMFSEDPITKDEVQFHLL